MKFLILLLIFMMALPAHAQKAISTVDYEKAKADKERRDSEMAAYEYNWIDKTYACLKGAGVGAVATVLGASVSNLSDVATPTAVGAALGCGIGYILGLQTKNEVELSEEVKRERSMAEKAYTKNGLLAADICDINGGKIDQPTGICIIEEDENGQKPKTPYQEDFFELKSGN